jgi:prolyl oligopeptidase
LLVAAAVTREPQLFAAAIANVGLYDMLRYPLFPPAQIWTSEFGDPTQAEAARWLHAYSPYHRVTAGERYPAVLIESADHDTRVHWAHSTKLAARLQEAQAGERPVYFFLERQQGHGAGTRLRDLVTQYSRAYAFIESQLGVK